LEIFLMYLQSIFLIFGSNEGLRRTCIKNFRYLSILNWDFAQVSEALQHEGKEDNTITFVIIFSVALGWVLLYSIFYFFGRFTSYGNCCKKVHKFMIKFGWGLCFIPFLATTYKIVVSSRINNFEFSLALLLMLCLLSAVFLIWIEIAKNNLNLDKCFLSWLFSTICNCNFFNRTEYRIVAMDEDNYNVLNDSDIQDREINNSVIAALVEDYKTKKAYFILDITLIRGIIWTIVAISMAHMSQPQLITSGVIECFFIVFILRHRPYKDLQFIEKLITEFAILLQIIFYIAMVTEDSLFYYFLVACVVVHFIVIINTIIFVIIKYRRNRS